jgi:PAS domain S-box-containing protein
MDFVRQGVVLLAEGTPPTSFAEVLARCGFPFIILHNLADLRDTLSKGRRIDLVLIDAAEFHPDSEMYAIIQSILSHHDIPLLFLVTQDEDLERTMGLSSCGYIDGRSSEAFFLAQIRAVLRRRAEERRRFEGEVLRYRRLCDELPVMMCTFLPDSTLTYVNKSYADYFREPVSDLIGKRFFDFIPKEEVPGIKESYRALTPQKPSISYAHQVERGVEHRWQEWTDYAFFGDTGDLEYLQSVGLDITERRRAEEQLEKRLLCESGLGSFSRELLFGLSSEGDSVTAALGYIREATDADRVYIFENFEDERDGLCMRQVFESCKPGVSVELDNPALSHIPYKPDFMRWYESLIQGIPIPGQIAAFPTGEQSILMSQGILSILVLPIMVNEDWYGFIGLDDIHMTRVWDVNDITILKVAAEIFSSYLKEKRSEARVKALLQEKELILREVHHRIKNNMITVHSLLSLQARNVKDPSAATALEDASSRVLSMMVLYSRLYQSNDFSEVSVDAYLPDLIRQIVRGFPNRGLVRIDTDIEAFRLGAKEMISVGIIINELITNIMKYAFDSGAAGSVRISAWQRDGRTTLIVEDNGKGMPEAVDVSNSPGFGLKLVGMLAAQLSGSIRIERGKGTKTILEFAS